ncbi:hypothetical protein HK098_001394 [Nowakowskiella sp. JEL0407]|nr:hypothetical protein HK098_001394 [Nowakowskiella sp. JEL0407]
MASSDLPQISIDKAPSDKSSTSLLKPSQQAPQYSTSSLDEDIQVIDLSTEDHNIQPALATSFTARSDRTYQSKILDPIELAMANKVIIRDFAFHPQDPRYWGHPPEPLSPTTSTDSDSSYDSDYDRLNSDSSDSSSSPTDNNTKRQQPYTFHSRTTATRKVTKSLALTKFEKLLRPYGKFRFRSVGVLYSFEKGSEWEMDLFEGDEVIVCEEVDDDDNGKSVDTNIDSKSSLGDRWSSIDDDLEDDDDGSELQFDMELEPELEELGMDIAQYIEGQRSYGDGWVAALKLRIKRKVRDGRGWVRIRKSDIGLVPKNYLSF